jgi:transposase-like protein
MLKREKGTQEIRQYSEALKRQVVLEYESGRATVRELLIDYDILTKASIYNWCRKYGKSKRATKVVRVIMKSEKERIRELEKAVADLTLKNRASEALIEVYEEDTELKKKLSSQQLERLKDLKAKLVSIQSGSSVKSSE